MHSDLAEREEKFEDETDSDDESEGEEEEEEEEVEISEKETRDFYTVFQNCVAEARVTLKALETERERLVRESQMDLSEIPYALGNDDYVLAEAAGELLFELIGTIKIAEISNKMTPRDVDTARNRWRKAAIRLGHYGRNIMRKTAISNIITGRLPPMSLEKYEDMVSKYFDESIKLRTLFDLYTPLSKSIVIFKDYLKRLEHLEQMNKDVITAVSGMMKLGRRSGEEMQRISDDKKMLENQIAETMRQHDNAKANVALEMSRLSGFKKALEEARKELGKTTAEITKRRGELEVLGGKGEFGPTGVQKIKELLQSKDKLAESNRGTTEIEAVLLARLVEEEKNLKRLDDLIAIRKQELVGTDVVALEQKEKKLRTLDEAIKDREAELLKLGGENKLGDGGVEEVATYIKWVKKNSRAILDPKISAAREAADLKAEKERLAWKLKELEDKEREAKAFRNISMMKERELSKKKAAAAAEQKRQDDIKREVRDRILAGEQTAEVSSLVPAAAKPSTRFRVPAYPKM